ncbi:lecithin retinol acyltransferase family protein [Streptomyces sp. NPDC001919]
MSQPADAPTRITPGDHLLTTRRFRYTHHGIYAGDLKVIHFQRGEGDRPWPELLSLVRIAGIHAPMSGGSTSNRGKLKSSVRMTSIAEFTSGDPLLVRVYTDTPVTLEESLQRAHLLLTSKHGTVEARSYDLFTFNCEHLATWCRTGDRISNQVAHQMLDRPRWDRNPLRGVVRTGTLLRLYAEHLRKRPGSPFWKDWPRAEWEDRFFSISYKDHPATP